MDEPLLLHSMSEHRDLIFACLDAVAPRRIVEIGSETGGVTRELSDWVAEHDAHLTTIEPTPTGEIRRLAEDAPHFSLVEGRSPAALTEAMPADVFVVDGDHNHWTVVNELRTMFSPDAEGHALAILHDVDWPCARRDQYYSPEAIPAEGLHEHSFRAGRVPGQSALQERGGFRGDGQFAVAVEEGGPRNGVLTAVEDFLAERAGFAFRRVPAVFGVGYVFPDDAPWAGRVREILDPWHESFLVSRLESNRIQLYAQVLELQDERQRANVATNRLLTGHEARIAELEAENAALRLERAKLRGALEAANGGEPAPARSAPGGGEEAP